MSSVSLAGSLEDLGLNDILQILSLSRKSGVLRLTSGDRGLDLFIRKGDCVAARPHPSIASLHRFLQEQGALSPTQMNTFLAVVKNKSFRPEPWTQFWASLFRLPTDSVEKLAEKYLIWLVSRAGNWRTGDFSFELDSTGATFKKIAQVPVFPFVEAGLSAQFLAMESARVQDESAASNSAAGDLDAGDRTITGAMPVADGVSTPHAEKPVDPGRAQRVLFIDPKPDSAERMAEQLRAMGYGQVATAQTADEAIDLLNRVGEDNWIVVTELVMPKRDRSGVLGGLEVTADLAKHSRVAAVFIASDLINDEIREQGKSAGATGFVAKPSRKAWKTSPNEALTRFARAVAEAIGAPIAPQAPPQPAEPVGEKTIDVSLDDPLAAIIGENTADLPVAAPRTPQAVQLLRNMVEELANPDAEPEVSLLILRFAADFFQRSVIFAVLGKQLVGLGQVGLLRRDADSVVRALKLPLGVGSTFDKVFSERRPWLGKPVDHPLHHQLFQRLGGPEPTEIYIAPVLAGGKIVAMLYADQVPAQSPIRGTEALEVFLAQAGLALERAYLLRRIREYDSKKGP